MQRLMRWQIDSGRARSWALRVGYPIHRDTVMQPKNSKQANDRLKLAERAYNAANRKRNLSESPTTAAAQEKRPRDSTNPLENPIRRYLAI